MTIIVCPRCGGTGAELSTGRKCRFCGGAKSVKIDDQELTLSMEDGLAQKDKDKVGMR